MVLSLILLVGPMACSPAERLDKANLPDRRLAPVLASMQHTIDTLDADPVTQWRSGWVGNMFTNVLGEGNRGLCYHWQEAIARGVAPSVRQAGLSMVGLAVNVANGLEHHAVVIFDPAAVSAGWETDPATVAAFFKRTDATVLDGWERGRADAYPMQSWISHHNFVRAGPALQTFDFFELSPAFPAVTSGQPSYR